jgi:glyoxylase-like metal-dependent hydrolase (beta-lactamase superfamily II)
MPVLLSCIAVLAVSGAARGQAQPAWTTEYAHAEETVSDLGHGLYAVIANVRPLAGNTTVAVGSDGLIVVDTQFAPLHDKLKARITGLSTLPIRFVVNTHQHGDHVGGNPAFAKDGALLVSAASAAQRMAHPPVRPDGTAGAPMVPSGLPVISYEGSSMTVRVGGQTARLLHPATPAHSDGDTIVYFPEANVISTGDIVNTLLYPNIDVGVGAGIDGMIAGVDQIDALADAKTQIVPGHGPVTNKAGLAEYRAMLVTARTRIAKAKAEGRSEQQVDEADLLADLNPRWLLPGSPFAARFARTVYQSLK